MMTLTPAEGRALLRRIEDRTTTAADAALVESLMDAGSNRALIAAIREMTAAMTESTTAEAATAAELGVWRERFTVIFERLALEEEERNRLLREQAQQRRDDTELAKTDLQEAGKTKRERIAQIAAIVLGVLSLVGTLAGYFYGASLAEM